MHNKSSKNGSERFWPTPQTMPSGDTPETLALRKQRLKDGGSSFNPGTSLEVAVQIPDYTTTSSPSTEPTTPALTYSQGDFLANLSVSPGSDSARQMTERSGRKCCELLGKPSPLGSLVKTLLESSRWNSTISYLTWKASATPRGRLLFRLVPSMPDTDATEFGLWPTPKEQDSRGGSGQNVQGGPSLTDNARLWPTPTAHLHKETNAPSEANRNEPSISSIVGGSLNPQFCEWLMGYPKDWTAVEHFANGRKKMPARLA